MLNCGEIVQIFHQNYAYAMVLETLPEEACVVLPLRASGESEALATEDLEANPDRDMPCLPPLLFYRADEAHCLSHAEMTTAGCRVHANVWQRMLRERARHLADIYYTTVQTPESFTPGNDPVPVSGKCWGPEELRNLMDASLDFWLTTGRFNDAFEKKFAKVICRKHTLTVNSGSSANLLAVSALCSPKLGDKRLKPGDEVITVAAGFPTTVAPFVQYGLIPVFVDVDSGTCNAVPDQIADAVTPKTRGICLAHTLGNPFDVNAVLNIATRHNLWVIEDSCDALGSTYTLDGVPRPCGSFGHISTFSFYPAHHITMGEGGAVTCDDPDLYRILMSMRDWGRDCWCAPGRDDTCKRRFEWKFPQLPYGYDHKYVYSHLGYNLKITDMQAAVGLQQLERLNSFTTIRRKNFTRLSEALMPLKDEILSLPEATPQSNPSWFGFLMTLKANHNREELLAFLNHHRIGTRLLFAGNITRQPCFENVPHRVAFPLIETNKVMAHAFWVGVFPGLTDAHIDFTAQKIREYFHHD